MTEAELIRKHIEQNPNHPGVADARLKDSGVPVWAIIGYLAAVENVPHRVALDYELSDEEVAAAIAHYRQYQREIGARIAENEIPVG